MPTDSDVRMAKLKAAINKCREGNLSAMIGIEISRADLITIGAISNQGRRNAIRDSGQAKLDWP